MPLPRPTEFPFDLALLPVPGKGRAKMYDAGTANFVEAPNIAITKGKIVEIGEGVRVELARTVRYVQEDQILTPEIHDIHVHFAKDIVWSQKMDVDRDFHASGTGRVVDAGSTGWINGPHFFDSIRNQRTRTHCKAFINIAPAGLVLPDGETAAENFRLGRCHSRSCAGF